MKTNNRKNVYNPPVLAVLLLPVIDVIRTSTPILEGSETPFMEF